MSRRRRSKRSASAGASRGAPGFWGQSEEPGGWGVPGEPGARGVPGEPGARGVPVEPGARGVPVEPVRMPADPTALLRSLGEPPLGPNPAAAQHHLAVVYDEAVRAAIALAAANGLLELPDDS